VPFAGRVLALVIEVAHLASQSLHCSGGLARHRLPQPSRWHQRESRTQVVTRRRCRSSLRKALLLITHSIVFLCMVLVVSHNATSVPKIIAQRDVCAEWRILMFCSHSLNIFVYANTARTRRIPAHRVQCPSPAMRCSCPSTRWSSSMPP
jgi:hypothetical protein